MPDLNDLYSALEDAKQNIRDGESQEHPRPWLEGAVAGIRNVLVGAASEYLQRRGHVPPPQPPLHLEDVRDLIVDRFEPDPDLGCAVASALGNTSTDMHAHGLDDLTAPVPGVVWDWWCMASLFVKRVEETTSDVHPIAETIVDS